MPTNLPPSPPGANGGRPRSARWGTSGKHDPVARCAAPDLGVQPKTVEHMIRGPRALNHTVAAIVRAFRKLGDEVRLARFLAPIEAAKADVCPLLTDQLEREAVERAHQAVEGLFLYEQDPTLAHAKLVIRAIDQELAELTLLRAAMAQQHEL